MTGLVKKDFYIGKNYLFIGAGLFFLGIVFSYIIRFAFIYGNLAKLEAAEFKESVLMVDLIFTLLPALLLLILFVQSVLSAIYTDFSCKWHLYISAAPISPQIIAGSKFLELIFLWILAFVLELCSSFVYGNIFGFSHAKSGILFYCVLAVVILLCSFCMIPMSYRYRTQNGVLIRMMLGFFLPVYLAFGIMLLHVEELNIDFFRSIKFWMVSHKELLCTVTLGLFLLVGSLSYLVCIHLIKRRDLLCMD